MCAYVLSGDEDRLETWQSPICIFNKNSAQQSPPPIYAILHGAVSCKGYFASALVRYCLVQFVVDGNDTAATITRTKTIVNAVSAVRLLYALSWSLYLMIYYLSPHCLQCYNRTQFHSSQVWRLKRVSRLFITRTSSAEHTVDHSHEISTFQHGLDIFYARQQ